MPESAKMDSRMTFGLQILRIATILAAAIAVTAPSLAYAGDLSGRVLQPHGEAAGGLALEIGALGLETFSADDGSYAFAGLPAGEHEITVFRADGGVQYMIVTVGEDATQRNIVLFSQAAVNAAMGRTAPASNGLSLSATLALGERLADDSEARGEMTWRWNDLEG